MRRAGHFAQQAVARQFAPSRQQLAQTFMRSFSSQPNPMAVFEQMGKEAMNKLQDNFKEPVENATRQVTEKSVEKISAVVNAMILLSRSNVLSEEELDSKLGQLLPPKMVELVKEQAKLLPPDPYMAELKDLKAQVAELSEKLDKVISEK